ncbi:MAG: isochorismatase family protein [Planctomycetota bacterium]
MRVREHWRAAGWPTFLIADDSTDPHSPYAPGQPGHDFHPELAPHASDQVVHKSAGGAFSGTDLATRLRQGGLQTLVVGGFMTNRCVATTVHAGADLGFEIIVLGDGTATVGLTDRRGRTWCADDVHELALADLAATAGVRVCTSEALLAALTPL